MKNNMQRQIRNYMKEISHILPNDYPNKRQILQSLEHNIATFIVENPECSFSDIITQFGSISEITDSFLEDYSGNHMGNSLRKKSIWICSVSIISFVAISLLVLYSVYLKNIVPTEMEETLIIYENTEE